MWESSSEVVAVISALLTGGINWWINLRKIEQTKNEFKEKQEKMEEQFKRDISNQQTLKYKEIITSERIKWLNKLRDTMCDVLKGAALLSGRSAIIIDKSNCESINEKYIEILSEFERNTSLVVMMLNPAETEFCEKIEEFKNAIKSKSENISDLANPLGVEPKDTDDEEICIMENLLEFESKCQILLKKEWEQIKQEARELNNIDTANNTLQSDVQEFIEKAIDEGKKCYLVKVKQK